MAKRRTYGRKWEKKRLTVLRNYNYICQESRRYGDTVEADTVHHIYPVELYPGLMYVDWNLLPVTASKHNTFHIRNTHKLTAKGKYWQRKRRREFEQWKRNKGQL